MTIDNVTQYTGSGDASPINVTHVCSGTNRLLLVLVGMYDSVDKDRTVTGITYNSVAMTQAISDNDPTLDVPSSWIYYLVAPATGSNTIAVTTDPTAGGVRNAIVAISLVDAPQVNPIGATKAAHGTSATPSTNIDTTLANSWVFDAMQSGEATPFTSAGAGQAIIANIDEGATGSFGVSRRDAGRREMSWVTGGSSPYAHTIVEVASQGPSVRDNRLRPAIYSPGIAR